MAAKTHPTGLHETRVIVPPPVAIFGRQCTPSALQTAPESLRKRTYAQPTPVSFASYPIRPALIIGNAHMHRPGTYKHVVVFAPSFAGDTTAPPHIYPRACMHVWHIAHVKA